MESKNALSAQERFKNAFETLGLPQKEIAGILQVSQKTVSNYLNGVTTPPESALQTLEAWPNVPVSCPHPRVSQLESLLWTIGKEIPNSREIVLKMLEMKEQLRRVLLPQEENKKSTDAEGMPKAPADTGNDQG